MSSLTTPPCRSCPPLHPSVLTPSPSLGPLMRTCPSRRPLGLLCSHSPWYFSDAISQNTGYHFDSYALKPWDPVRPSGSTNYSKLANVSISHDSSPAAIFAAQGLDENGTPDPLAHPPSCSFQLTWLHVFLARNWNILRVAN